MLHRSEFHVQSPYCVFQITDDITNSVKTIIILTYGWVSEGRSLTLKDSIGIILALGGASAYSQLSQK